MLSLLLFAGALVQATPDGAPAWHYPRQVANSTITSGSSGSAAVTGTAVHNCSWTWDRWLSKSVDAEFNTFNLTETYTYYNLTASVTTECDGVTRIVGDLTTVATGTNTSDTYTTHNYTVPTPTCTPAPADCAEINAGWGTYPCPRPTSQVHSSCGQCSIWGGTVDLFYFPITATTSHNLCPDSTISPGSATVCPLGPTTASANATNPYDYQPCYYATGNQTSTKNTGPYIVSGGHTFYQNRAYISLQTAFARDACGTVGKPHGGTILELKSQEVYSVGGYHHEFMDAGYQFNFQDLQAVPSYAYYMDCDAGGPASCYYEGTRYRLGTDFLNGQTNIDLGDSGVESTQNRWIFQEAYTPILLLPTQIRDLDPAWASCSLNLGGLYDPPKALTQAPFVPEPTQPIPGNGGGTTTAQPGNGPTTVGPSPTALPDKNPTTTAGNGGGQQTDTPDEPSNGGNDDTPAPTTPNEPDQPETTGGQGGDASPTTTNDPDQPETIGGQGGDASPTAPTDTSPTNDGDASSGGNNGGDNNSDHGGDGQNSGGGSENSNDSSATTTAPNIGGIVVSAVQSATTTQNLGGIIASIIGYTSANDQDDQATPAPTGVSSGNDDSSDQDSLAPSVGNSGDDDNAGQPVPVQTGANSGDDASAGQPAPNSDNGDNAAEPAPAPVTFTADDGSTQIVSAVQGTSNAFVIDHQTMTAGGAAIEVNGVTISAGSSGQVVAGTQTLDANAGAQTPAPLTGGDGTTLEVSTISAGSSGVFVVDDTTLSVGGSAAIVNGVQVTAGPLGVVNVDVPAPTGSDGARISISTITSGSSGVYVADGTTLSVGGDEQIVNGATISAAPTGIANVGDDHASASSRASGTGSSSGGASSTGSASSPQQTGSNAVILGRSSSIVSGVAYALAAVLALR